MGRKSQNVESIGNILLLLFLAFSFSLSLLDLVTFADPIDDFPEKLHPPPPKLIPTTNSWLYDSVGILAGFDSEKCLELT